MGEQNLPAPAFVKPGETGSAPAREATIEEVTSAAGRDASEDAALERLFGEGGRGQAALAGDVGLPTSFFDVHGKAPAPQSAPKAEPPAAQPAAPAPVEPRADDETYRLGAAALRRDGMTTEDVALLPRERVIALGEHRRRVQENVDTHYEELVQLRGRGEAARENEARRGENEAEALPSEVLQTIQDRLGIDEAGARAFADSIRAPLLSQVAAANQQIADTRRLAMQTAAENARRDLAERFPQVKDAQSFQRVLNRMDMIQRQGTGQYGDVGQLMEDAVLLEFSGEIAARAAQQQQQLRDARANGQMTTVPVKDAGGQKRVARKDYEDAFLNELFGDGAVPYADRLAAARRIGIADR